MSWPYPASISGQNINLLSILLTIHQHHASVTTVVALHQNQDCIHENNHIND